MFDAERKKWRAFLNAIATARLGCVPCLLQGDLQVGNIVGSEFLPFHIHVALIRADRGSQTREEILWVTCGFW